MVTVREYECGCKITTDKSYPSVEYCPLHKSASDLYEALKEVLNDANNGSFTSLAGSVQKLGEQALAKVEGGK